MKKPKITGFRVLIRPDEIEKESKGGIVIVQNERRTRAAQTTGVIVDIGRSAWKAYDDGKPWAAIGDRVVYTRYGGRYIPDPEDEEKDLIIVNDEDVLAVLPK